MAVPARVSAAQDPPHSRRKSDPMSPGWASVQQGLIIAVQACALAVTELARRPDDDGPALEMARLCLAAQEKWAELAGRWALDEAVLAAERRRGYDQGVADCKAARCRLEVVPD